MLVIGDIHGKYTDYLKLLYRYHGEPSVQIGDFGFGFGPVPGRPKDSWFFRGNHDSPDEARQDSHYLGDYGIREIDGVKFFFLGGAWSIDWRGRQPGVSWWFDEELSQQELDRAIALYSEVRPDIVLSHDGPNQATELLVSLVPVHKPLTPTRTGEALTKMYEIHQPAQWIFGHWHARWARTIGRTDFRCLAELGWCQIHGEHYRETQARLVQGAA